SLWERVKARQGALAAGCGQGQAPGYWDRRRPRYLFTGLMRCAVCGGGIVHFNKIYIGCANARNKGTCDNKGTMRRADLEKAVLDGLQTRLMEPARTKIFCEEYARHEPPACRTQRAAGSGRRSAEQSGTRSGLAGAGAIGRRPRLRRAGENGRTR